MIFPDPQARSGVPSPQAKPSAQMGAHVTPVTRYVPTLFDRTGELNALRHAAPDIWASMQPIIQVELKNLGRGTDRLQSKRAAMWRVADAVGPHPVFLDVLSPRNRPSQISTLELAQIHDDALMAGIRFVPVMTAGTKRPVPAVARIARDYGVGAMIRVEIARPDPERRGWPALLVAELDGLGLQCDAVDLLLDLGFLDRSIQVTVDEIADIVRLVATVGPWRSITISGTSLPHSLAQYPRDVLTPLFRIEWSLYQSVVDVLRMPLGFGDHAVQHLRSPKSGGRGPIPNIRYTYEAATWMALGSAPAVQLGSDATDREYVRLCQMILEQLPPAGRESSWGDELLEDCARRRIPPERQQMWRGVGTSRHLRVVATQLQERDRAAAIRLTRSSDALTRTGDGLATASSRGPLGRRRLDGPQPSGDDSGK